MRGRGRLDGVWIYLGHLAACVVFPLLWWRSLRFAREHHESDPRGRAKVAVAVVVAVAVTAAGAAGLMWIHERGTDGVYSAMESRLAGATGEDRYQAGLDEAADALNGMQLAALRLNDTVQGEEAAEQAQAQLDRAQWVTAAAEGANLTLESLEAANRTRTLAQGLGVSLSGLQEAQAILADPEAFPEESVTRAERIAAQAQEANLTVALLRESGDLLEAAADAGVTIGELRLARSVLAAHAAAPFGTERQAEAAAAFQSHRQRHAQWVSDDAGIAELRRESDTAALLDALGNDASSMQGHAENLFRAAYLVNTSAALQWNAVYEAAAEELVLAVGKAQDHQEHHALFLRMQAHSERRDDAMVLQEARTSTVQQDRLVERTERAVAVKDEAQAGLGAWMMWLLVPSLLGWFFAPLVFAQSSILRSTFEPSDSVGFKPYPGAAGGWFLLMGAFGVPALFFAAWVFKDIQDRTREGQIAL